jgi:hypothetical protein
MGPVARGIALIAHVSYEKAFLRVLEMEVGLERTELHHAGAQTVADQYDAGTIL